MAMAVRYGDNKRLQLLEGLIDKNFDKIQEIIKSYHIPVLPIPQQEKVQRDDD